jgi:FAD/FMN-containing dehydrogenase
MNEIVVHEDSKAVEIGAGLIYSDVYSFLVPKGIGVVGSRLGDVGVAGFTLGGGDSFLLKVHCVDRLKNAAGYSWKTNQYGLAMDNVMEFELVLPNGQIKVVTEQDKDLWFALRVRRTSSSGYKECAHEHQGGFNNYVSLATVLQYYYANDDTSYRSGDCY